MGGEVETIAFLACVWVADATAKSVLSISPIIGTLVVGILLGPALADIVPYPDSWRLIGKLGVMLLVIDSGLSVDVFEVQKLFGRAFLAALTGVICPVLLSIFFYYLILGQGLDTALAIGAALAPTSLGFSATLLKGAQLTTPLGQLICTAAVVDDVLSLLLLSEVQALGKDNPGWLDFAVPAFASFGTLVVGACLTAAIAKRSGSLHTWLEQLEGRKTVSPAASPRKQSAAAVAAAAAGGGGGLGRPTRRERVVQDEEEGQRRSLDIEQQHGRQGGQDRDMEEEEDVVEAEAKEVGGRLRIGDRVLLFMVLATSILFAWLSSFVGSSDLLGCFFGGLSFSSIPGVKKGWDRQMKVFVQWGGLRLFFAATIGFSVPPLDSPGGLFAVTSLKRGAMLAVLAVLGKLCVGAFAVPLTVHNFFKLGWAMNGRGEFSFLIAEEGFEEGILEATDYSAAIWGALLSSLLAPFAFRYLLAREGSTDIVQVAERKPQSPEQHQHQHQHQQEQFSQAAVAASTPVMGESSSGE